MKRIIYPSLEEIIKINKLLGYKIANGGALDFIYSKIKSIRRGNDYKKNIAKISGHIWFEIISMHPFVDGNKRTAAEAMKFFLQLNKCSLNMPPNGIIYISLQIANKDTNLNDVINTIYNRIDCD